MGGKSSKVRARRSLSGGREAVDQWSQYGSPYNQRDQYCMPQHRYAPSPSPASSSSYGYGTPTPHQQRRLERKYMRIADNYRSLDEVSLLLQVSAIFMFELTRIYAILLCLNWKS